MSRLEILDPDGYVEIALNFTVYEMELIRFLPYIGPAGDYIPATLHSFAGPAQQRSSNVAAEKRVQVLRCRRLRAAAFGLVQFIHGVLKINGCLRNLPAGMARRQVSSAGNLFARLWNRERPVTREFFAEIAQVIWPDVMLAQVNLRHGDRAPFSGLGNRLARLVENR